MISQVFAGSRARRSFSRANLWRKSANAFAFASLSPKEVMGAPRSREGIVGSSVGKRTPFPRPSTETEILWRRYITSFVAQEHDHERAKALVKIACADAGQQADEQRDGER
jgi:hypothetical protein